MLPPDRLGCRGGGRTRSSFCGAKAGESWYRDLYCRRRPELPRQQFCSHRRQCSPSGPSRADRRGVRYGRRNNLCERGCVRYDAGGHNSRFTYLRVGGGPQHRDGHVAVVCPGRTNVSIMHMGGTAFTPAQVADDFNTWIGVDPASGEPVTPTHAWRLDEASGTRHDCIGSIDLSDNNSTGSEAHITQVDDLSGNGFHARMRPINGPVLVDNGLGGKPTVRHSADNWQFLICGLLSGPAKPPAWSLYALAMCTDTAPASNQGSQGLFNTFAVRGFDIETWIVCVLSASRASRPSGPRRLDPSALQILHRRQPGKRNHPSPRKHFGSFLVTISILPARRLIAPGLFSRAGIPHEFDLDQKGRKREQIYLWAAEVGRLLAASQ